MNTSAFPRTQSKAKFWLYLVGLTFLFSNLSMIAAKAEGMKTEDGGVIYDLSSMGECKGTFPCKIKDKLVTVVMPDTTHVGANAPITAIEACNYKQPYGADIESGIDDQGNAYLKTKYFAFNDNPPKCFWHELKKPYKNKIANSCLSTSNYDCTTFIRKIKIFTSAIDLPNDLKLGSSTLIFYYQNALTQASAFEGMLKKSDRRHLARLKTTLADTLKIMVDEKATPLLPITHHRITEGSRMIMVLSTVLNELIEDYADTTNEAMKIPIDTLAKLPTQIRESYGWDQGLAGPGSKALYSLATVLDIEISDLASTMASFGNPNPETFNQLRRANYKLGQVIRASNSGDAAVNTQMKELAMVWNDLPWQNMLAQLQNASQDYQKLVQPKLKLLLMASESISQFVDPKGDQGLTLKISDKVSSTLELKAK